MGQLFDNSTHHEKFHLIGSTERSQAATMELLPDEASSSDENKHPRSDQWIYVVSGKGVAVVSGEMYSLSEGSMLLIEAGETHKISGSDGDSLKMVTFYSPPAY